MKLLTATQMREMDRRSTEECGIPSLQLMENAGERVAEFVLGLLEGSDGRTAVVLCGKGNNGGDGFVTARVLRKQGCAAHVLLFATLDEVKGDAAVNLNRWVVSGGELTEVTSLSDWTKELSRCRNADILIDALLGTGLNGPITGLLSRVIEDLNATFAREQVVAIDVPSGLLSDGGDSHGPVVRAGHTITFTAPKVGQFLGPMAECVGKLHVRKIGSPDELMARDPNLRLHWLEPSEWEGRPFMAARRPDTHKGDYGHALIVAGSRGKTGAAVLAAAGALRSGAGLVTVATPDSVQATVASGLPEMMTDGLAATDSGSISLRALDYGGVPALLKGKSVVAVGPGLSKDPETQQFVRTVVAECTLPMVLDADGLNAFAGCADTIRNRRGNPLVVTPHPGEMARLAACSTEEVQRDRLQVALRAASRWDAHVVLKGHRTIVACPDGRAFINSTGNPGMATAGTGDVLCGILTGLTAQYGASDWEYLLSFGVTIQGMAGDLAAERYGQAPMIASDILRALPDAFKRVRSNNPP